MQKKIFGVFHLFPLIYSTVGTTGGHPFKDFVGKSQFQLRLGKLISILFKIHKLLHDKRTAPNFDLIYYLEGITLFADFPRVRVPHQGIVTLIIVGHLLPALILPCKSTLIE